MLEGFICVIAVMVSLATGQIMLEERDQNKPVNTVYRQTTFEGNTKMIELVSLDNNFDIDAPIGRHGATALHIAAHNGDLTTMAFLLERFADPNVMMKGRKRPIHLAVDHPDRQKAYKMCHMLLEAGANPNVMTSRGSGWHWPVERAMHHGDKKLADLIFSYYPTN